MAIKPRSGDTFLNLLFVLIQLIGSTRPKYHVWPNRRSTLNLGNLKLEFSWSHEKFDVWPRPKAENDLKNYGDRGGVIRRGRLP